MNRRFWSLALGCALGASLVIAPLTSFASASVDEQTQITRANPCPGHEYIVQPTGSFRYFWKNKEEHTYNKEFIQICQHCGTQGGYAYVEKSVSKHTKRKDMSNYHPSGTTIHQFYYTCINCGGVVGDKIEVDCPGGEYGHVTHP